MSLTCNIDARGKVVRLIYGVILLIAAVLVAVFWAATSATLLAWSVVAALVLAGGFGIFEARAGWCVVRAMGFKTRF